MARGRFRTGPSFDDRATGKFSGSPAGWRGSNRQPGIETANTRRRYPTPSNRQPGISQANVRPRTGSTWRDKAGNLASGIANTGKTMGKGFVHPFQMMAGSIAQNRADHDYLDEVYGDKKGAALFRQATDQFYDRGVYAPDSFEPMTNAIGMSFGDIEEGGGGTRGGVSFGQAKKYFNRSGITDQALERFIKEGKSDAWLRAQADGDKSELFDTGMSFIKNAKASANLRRSTEAARNQLADESLPYRSGIEQEGGPPRSYPVDTETVFGDFSSGIEQEGGAPYSYDVTEEDITADIGGSPYNVTTGYDRDKIYDFEKQRPKTTFRNRFTGRKHDPYDLVGTPTFPFSDENMAGDYTAGYPGMDVMNQMTPGDMTGETLQYRDRNVGTRGAAGSFDELYMNRIGDVINRGPRHIVPNISVEFGEQEEETPYGKFNPRSINPVWNK